MSVVNTIPPSDYELIESVVNKLPPNVQEDARALFQSFSAGVQQTKAAVGLPSSANQQNVAAPPAATLSVEGANGAFNVSITNPTLSSPTTLWHEISYSPVANFTSQVTTMPPTQSTGVTVNLPGQTLYFRIRSSTNQVVWNNYAVFGSAVSSELVSSAATSEAGAFNQTNYAVVDSTAVGSTAEVSIAGASGPLTNLVRQKGPAQTVLPSSTIYGVTPGSDQFVAYDGEGYVLAPTLAGALQSDENVPIGKVSVVETGAPTLPVIVPIISGGGVVGYNVTNQGNGITGPLNLVVSDPGGPGTGATTGAQTITSGKLISVAPGNAGANYDGSTIVTASGGIGPGTPGGGTAVGGNGGRMTNV